MPSNIGYWEQVLQAPTPAYQELFRFEKEYIIKHVPKGARVLDIGCGDGRNIRSILEKTKQIVGVDNDKAAVEDARRSFADVATVEIIQADASNLPFGDGSFDVVTFLMILPNLNDLKEKVMQEIARVLKSDGKIILSTFSESAFEERMKIYQQVKVPILKIEGTKFIFDKSLGANTSEQFSKKEIQALAEHAGLEMIDSQKVNTIGYICTLQKKYTQREAI